MTVRDEPSAAHPSDGAAIFIHSLWRSGSTYLFNVFRRSGVGYWCYQEPLHEFVLDRQDSPIDLLEVGRGSTELLRHPVLDRPYLQELFDTYGDWRGRLRKASIYDRYFQAELDPATQDYLAALIAAAKGRPVLQECRTSCRIGAIRRAMGGTHIFLSRNPWDQWWSFKTTSYFDVAAMLVAKASDAPDAMVRLRRAIGLAAFDDDDIATEYKYFDVRPLGAAASYKLFFTLWCLAWLEGVRFADVALDIDAISVDPDARERAVAALSAVGIHGIDLSDARVHRSTFSRGDAAFFVPIEREVFSLLMASGIEGVELSALRAARKGAHAMAGRSRGDAPTTDAEHECARLRMLAIRQADDQARRIGQLFAYLDERERILAGDAAEAMRQIDEMRARLNAAGDDPLPIGLIRELAAAREASDRQAQRHAAELDRLHGMLDAAERRAHDERERLLDERAGQVRQLRNANRRADALAAELRALHRPSAATAPSPDRPAAPGEG